MMMRSTVDTKSV